MWYGKDNVSLEGELG